MLLLEAEVNSLKQQSRELKIEFTGRLRDTGSVALSDTMPTPDIPIELKDIENPMDKFDQMDNPL